jgi:hypothetical protein
MCATWGVDNTKDQTLAPAANPVTVKITNDGAPSGNDLLTVTGVTGACNGTFNFGKLDLGSAGYVATDVTFSNSKLTWNHNGTLTLTLGTPSAATSAVNGTTTATYTPSGAMTDPNGNAAFGSAAHAAGGSSSHF